MTSDQVRLCPGDAALPSLSSYRIAPHGSQPAPPRNLLMRLKILKFGYAAPRVGAVLLAFSALCFVPAPALARASTCPAPPASSTFQPAPTSPPPPLHLPPPPPPPP